MIGNLLLGGMFIGRFIGGIGVAVKVLDVVSSYGSFLGRVLCGLVCLFGWLLDGALVGRLVVSLLVEVDFEFCDT